MNEKIMIVEDRLDTLSMVVDALVAKGYVVISATSGQECLDKLEKTSIDLILLDIMMPGMSGIDVLKKIRSNKKFDKVKVLIITASKPSDNKKKDALRIGAQGYVSKPIAIDALREEIKRILGK